MFVVLFLISSSADVLCVSENLLGSMVNRRFRPLSRLSESCRASGETQQEGTTHFLICGSHVMFPLFIVLVSTYNPNILLVYYPNTSLARGFFLQVVCVAWTTACDHSIAKSCNLRQGQRDASNLPPCFSSLSSRNSTRKKPSPVLVRCVF
jgi:hypothetical protein